MASLSTPANNAPAADVWKQPGRLAALCLGLAVITFAVFGQTLSHPFLAYDDDIYVYNNPTVSSGVTWNGVVWAFTQPHAYNWHPLTWISHMLDCQIYGLDPWGHHLTNVLLHAAGAMALFLVLKEMTGAVWRGAFIAAVFAIHPLRVESVAWVAERKDVLSGLFFFLTIWSYTRYIRQRAMSFYILSIFLFALGLMSKPMLVTLPLVLLLLDYWPLQRAVPLKRLLLEKLPFAALSAGSCLLTVWAQNHAIRSASHSMRLENIFVTGMTYLVQMEWPVGLALFYPFPPHGFPKSEVLMAGLLVVGISIMTWEQRKIRPWFLVGWLWYLIMLLPVVGVVQVGLQAHADRYTYLPQIGIYLIVTWFAVQYLTSRAARQGLALAVIAALMICAWRQTRYWKDGETLWAHTLACTPDNESAEYDFAVVLEHDGKTDDAITHYQRSAEINPRNALVFSKLGGALLKKGDIDAAIAQFQSALALNPEVAATQNDLGRAFMQKSRVDDAIVCFKKVVALNPSSAAARANLDSALLQKQKADDASAR